MNSQSPSKKKTPLRPCIDYGHFYILSNRVSFSFVLGLNKHTMDESRLEYNCFSFHKSDHEASFCFGHPGYDAAVDKAALASLSFSSTHLHVFKISNIHLSVHEA